MTKLTFRPVSVWETGSRSFTIADVDAAARWLMERWPADVKKPASYQVALVACLSALEGGSSPDEVRAALVAAAEDADILDRRGH